MFLDRYQGFRAARRGCEDDARAAEKLALVREQVERGSLVIRQKTDKGRRRYPSGPDQPSRPGRR